MRVTYACPACQATVMCDAIETLAVVECPACRATLSIPADAFLRGMTAGAAVVLDSQPRLRRCVICPSTELFIRKNFPQRVGVGIVVAGLAASCVEWAFRELFLTFGILFATAIVDVVLYLFMPNCLSCYRCQARYSGDGVTDTYGEFDLETHEKYRQQVARTKQLSTRPPESLS